MAQYGFYFDSTRCTGCRTCEMACKDYKDLPQTIAFRKVYDYEGGNWTAQDNGSYSTDCFAYHVSLSCNHCAKPACLPACPQGAISKDENTGIVSISEDTCVGDGACAIACPYEVPFVDPAKGQAVKCDLCQNRVAEGKTPICVEACPLRALDFGDIQELQEKYGSDAAIAPLPTADLTIPSLVIKPCPAAKESGDTEGEIGNVKELMGVEAFTA